MPFKRREAETTIEEERDALRAQHAALEELKRQLAERIDAVRERELDLHHALAEAGAPAVVVTPLPARVVEEADTDESALAFQQREQGLQARERALEARELRIAARERELEDRAAQIAAATASAAPKEPEPAAAGEHTEQLARIEARLAELKEAEKLFLRTRDELAGRSEAVAARERLVAQKERELDEREDAGAPVGGPALSEMEARLRRLEQHQPGEQTLGFSGGLKRLQEESRPQRGR
jgi:hypothetical protein